MPCPHTCLLPLTATTHAGFNLRRIVEHSVIRAKDIITYSYAPPGDALHPHTVVHLDDPNAPAPRITGADVSPSGASDGVVPVLGPIAVLRNTSFPAVLAAAEAGLPSSKQLGHLIAQLLSQGAPVYGQPVAMAFSLGSLPTLQLASDFYAYYLAQKTAPPKGEAGIALMNAQRLAAMSRAKAPAQPAVAPKPPALDNAAGGPIRDMFLEFWEAWSRGEGRGGRIGGVTAALPDYMTMPRRFADVTTRKHNPRGQHPCYQTSNNDYGLKKPTQLDMPNTYKSSSQAFTNTFPVGHGKSSALLTSITRSKVHKVRRRKAQRAMAWNSAADHGTPYGPGLDMTKGRGMYTFTIRAGVAAHMQFCFCACTIGSLKALANSTI